MKKPTKQAQLIRQFSCINDLDGQLTASDLRHWAADLDNRGVEYLDIVVRDYEGVIIDEVRYETKEEAEKRYIGAVKRYEKHKKEEKEKEAKRKEELIKEAQKLGLKVEEQ